MQLITSARSFLTVLEGERRSSLIDDNQPTLIVMSDEDSVLTSSVNLNPIELRMIGQEALSGRMTGLSGRMTGPSGRMTGLSRRMTGLSGRMTGLLLSREMFSRSIGGCMMSTLTTCIEIHVLHKIIMTKSHKAK